MSTGVFVIPPGQTEPTECTFYDGFDVKMGDSAGDFHFIEFFDKDGKGHWHSIVNSTANNEQYAKEYASLEEMKAEIAQIRADLSEAGFEEKTDEDEADSEGNLPD